MIGVRQLEICQPRLDGAGGKNENLISSRYWLHYELPNQLHVYDFTGGLTLDTTQFRQPNEEEDVLLSLFIEEGVPDNCKVQHDNNDWVRSYDLKAVHWEASAHLMTISNNPPGNMGWKIDTVDFVQPSSLGHYIKVRIRVGISNTDGVIIKVGYRLAVTGVVTYQDIPFT